MSKKPPSAELHRSALWALLGILAVLALEQLTGFDRALQDLLYDAAAGRWLIDPNAALPRLLWYRLPKLLLAAAGLGALALALGPASWRRGLARRDLAVFFTVMALVPLTVGALKSLTRVSCPCELTSYGGRVAYVKLFSAYAPEDRPEVPGRCFPAAHASGGFALMGLLAFGAGRDRFRRGFLIGSGAGFLLGFYQMARGVHFASHTLVSWLLAWLIALLVDHLWPRAPGAAAPAAGEQPDLAARPDLSVRPDLAALPAAAAATGLPAAPAAATDGPPPPRRAGVVLKIGPFADFDPGQRGYRGAYWAGLSSPPGSRRP